MNAAEALAALVGACGIPPATLTAFGLALLTGRARPATQPTAAKRERIYAMRARGLDAEAIAARLVLDVAQVRETLNPTKEGNHD